MRRLVSLFALLLFAVPAGVSFLGCSTGQSGNFCSGSSGPLTGAVQTITLQPQIGGVSLNYGQSTTVQQPVGTDCKNSTVTLKSVVYAQQATPGEAQSPVDVNPNTGQLCAGQWNRYSPGGVADYTTCNPTNVSGTAYITASSGGATSNRITVYVHPVITAIQIGSPSKDCVNDPATNCPQYPAGDTTTAPAYDPNSCLSFGQSAQIVARFYAGTQNVTYQAGSTTFAPQTPNIVGIDNVSGVATAAQPGTTVVTATLTNAKSTAGTISVCPPRSIVLTSPNSVNGHVNINPNTTEPLTATVLDTKGVPLTGLSLTYVSTTPVSLPVSSSGISPVFPGQASVTAMCLPPTCNPAPIGNVGLFGTGKPIVSNAILATTPGTSSTKLWIASTDSRYIVPVDFTTGIVPTPIILPYTPNSMVVTQNSSTIFMGSSVALMTFATKSDSVAKVDPTIQGSVLAVSPDSATVVVTDPTRKLVYIYQPANSNTVSTYSGVGVRASFTPDGSSVYIVTADNRLLVYNNFSSWSSYALPATSAADSAHDVTVTVPSVGAFVGTGSSLIGHSYCARTNNPDGSVVTPIDFFPQSADVPTTPAVTDRILATDDAKHLLDVRLPAPGSAPVLDDFQYQDSISRIATGSSTSSNGTVTTSYKNVVFPNSLPTGDCPEDGSAPVFGLSAPSAAVLGNIAPDSLTGLFATSDSATAFTTYTVPGAFSGTGLLPAYNVQTGAVTDIPLASGATAPVYGTWSSDNATFFTGTSGDDKVHLIDRATLTDKSQIAPNLPSNSNPGGNAVPNLLVQIPRAATATSQQ